MYKNYLNCHCMCYFPPLLLHRKSRVVHKFLINVNIDSLTNLLDIMHLCIEIVVQ